LNYTRYLADGGIFTASDAKEYHLIDAIGYLEDAIKEVREQAGLGEDYKVVVYDRPAALLSSLLGIQAAPVDPGRLSSAAIPRLWYLSPQTELAGVLAAMAKP
jgi:ClpP class serine protease